MNASDAEPKPSRAGLWLVVIPVLLVTATWWFLFDPQQLPDGFDSRTVPQQPVVVPPVQPPAGATSNRNEPEEPQRIAVAAPPAVAPSAVAAFASTDEDGKPIIDAVRNGLVVRVRTIAGAPCAAFAIEANWRKGFGLYGKDVGYTDAAGRFATTVARPEFFEVLQVTEPRLGTLEYFGDVLPAANDMNVVEVVVPEVATLRVHVVDELGASVAGAEVVVAGGPERDRPRQHVLRTGAPDKVVTDAKGAVTVPVVQGVWEVAAMASGCTSPQKVRAIVGAEGGDATVVVMRIENRVEIAVEVRTPPGTGAPKVGAWTNEPPQRSPEMHGRGLDADHRSFRVDTFTNGRFAVQVEDVAWQCAVSADGCTTKVVPVPRGERRVAVELAVAPPPPPVAHLLVTVLGVDGAPANADVRVHERPDLVSGSDESTTKGRVEIVREPGKRICVSARASHTPWTVSAPIELTPGDHEVTLQLQPASRITGRVVDAQGNGVKTNVLLLRPAGALRGLAANVPEILEHAANGDFRGGIEDGRFWFDACGPGEHVVWAFPEVGWPATKRVAPGADVTIHVGEGLDDLALVDLLVRDDTTLAPLAYVWIDCATGAGSWHRGTDADGRFRFAARPGDLTVTMRLRGYALRTVTTPNVTRGPHTLELRLPRSPVLFVRVLDAAGAPLDNAEVSVLGSNGEPIELLDQFGTMDGDVETTNANGRADVRGAPAGVLRVRVTRGEERREFDVPANAGRDDVFDLRW